MSIYALYYPRYRVDAAVYILFRGNYLLKPAMCCGLSVALDTQYSVQHGVPQRLYHHLNFAGTLVQPLLFAFDEQGHLLANISREAA